MTGIMMPAVCIYHHWFVTFENFRHLIFVVWSVHFDLV
jgi:hypothetical protein